LPERQSRLTLADVRRDPDLFRILLDHAYRGVRVQMLLRIALVVFVVATVIAVPPVRYRTGCYVTAGLYTAWVIGLAWLSQRGGERPVRLIWLTLFVDLAVLTVLSILAGQSQQSWTADILVNGFFVIPMIATAQLRPIVGVAVTAPTVAVYLAASIAARHANIEPWASILLRTGVLAALSAGAVLLCSVQRSRVLMIAGLASDRTALVGRMADVEGQARRGLAEELHDGALQYVLAARQDLADLRERASPQSFDRLDFALRESTALLRAKVSQLHPAVLEQSGLLRALQELVRTTAERGDLDITVQPDGWDEQTRTPHDELMYSAAREFLSNVTRHAHARSVRIALQRGGGLIRLTVSDDGVGLPDGVLADKLAKGHIGIAAQRVRIEAAGGRFSVRPGHPGTVAEAELPDRS
jgi:two-component system NarL family sensor kinase